MTSSTSQYSSSPSLAAATSSPTTNASITAPVQCKCKEGFSGDRCEKKDTIDCECQNDGVCDLDSGKCKCKAGFTGDKCEKKDGSGCGCQNGGFCLDSGECKCKVGFSGDKCENRDDFLNFYSK